MSRDRRRRPQAGVRQFGASRQRRLGCLRRNHAEITRGQALLRSVL